jgi:hypothetical protein
VSNTVDTPNNIPEVANLEHSCERIVKVEASSRHEMWSI